MIHLKTTDTHFTFEQKTSLQLLFSNPIRPQCYYLIYDFSTYYLSILFV